MIVNNLIQNPYTISNINTIKPLNKEANSVNANNMPNNSKVVEEINVSKRALNNTSPNFLRFAYSGNQAVSNGSLTESFIRAKASLSPIYFNNEIITRYSMISTLPSNLSQMKNISEKIA
jgi:hypothetical protein